MAAAKAPEETGNPLQRGLKRCTACGGAAFPALRACRACGASFAAAKSGASLAAAKSGAPATGTVPHAAPATALAQGAQQSSAAALSVSLVRGWYIHGGGEHAATKGEGGAAADAAAATAETIAGVHTSRGGPDGAGSQRRAADGSIVWAR